MPPIEYIVANRVGDELSAFTAEEFLNDKASQGWRLHTTVLVFAGVTTPPIVQYIFIKEGAFE